MEKESIYRYCDPTIAPVIFALFQLDFVKSVGLQLDFGIGLGLG